MDKHKNYKRSSILKKFSSAESTPTATFTRQMRRISFSAKNSVKEFRSGEDKSTIWGSSYEQSDAENTCITQDKIDEKTLIPNVELNDQKDHLNESHYNLRSSMSKGMTSFGPKYKPKIKIIGNNFTENDENKIIDNHKTVVKSKIIIPILKQNEKCLLSKTVLTNSIVTNNIVDSTPLNTTKSQCVRPAGMMATIEKKLQQIAKKNNNLPLATINDCQIDVKNVIIDKTEENNHKTARRTLTFEEEKQNSIIAKTKENIKNQYISANITIPYNISELMNSNSSEFLDKQNETSIALVRESLDRIEADLMLHKDEHGMELFGINVPDNENNYELIEMCRNTAEPSDILIKSTCSKIPILNSRLNHHQKTISENTDMDITDYKHTNITDNFMMTTSKCTILNDDSSINESIFNLTKEISFKLPTFNVNKDLSFSNSSDIICSSETNIKLCGDHGKGLNSENRKTIFIDETVHNDKDIYVPNRARETIYSNEKMDESISDKLDANKLPEKIIEMNTKSHSYSHSHETTTDFQLKSQELSKPDRANKYREHDTLMSTKSRKTILSHVAMDVTLRPDAGLVEEEKLIFEKENICQDKKNGKPQSRQTVYAVDDMDETTTDFQLKTQELSKPDRANKYREHKTHMATKSRKTILCHDAMDVTLRPDAGLVEEEELIFEKENICQDKKNEKPKSRQTVYAAADMDEITTDFQLKFQELPKPDRANKYREHNTPMSTKSRKTILGHDTMDVTLRPDAGLVEEEELIFEKENICQDKKNEKPKSRQTVYAAADMDEITTDFQLKFQELPKPDRANKYREHNTPMSTKSRKTILGHDTMDVTLGPDAGLVEEEELIFEKENICQDKKNEKPNSRQTVYAVDDMDETTTDFQLKTQELSKPDRANKYREHKTHMATKSRKTILCHDAMDVTLRPDAGLVEEEKLIFEKENICQDKKNGKPQSRQTVYAVDDMDETTTDFQLKTQELSKPDRANKYREHKTHMATKSRKTILCHDAMDVTLRPDAGLVEEEELIFEKENICQDKKNEKPKSRQTVYAAADMDEITTDFQLKFQELPKPDRANKYREHNTPMSTKSRKTILGHDTMDVTLGPDAGLVEEEELIFEKENICQDKKNEKPNSRQTVYAAADMDEITTDFQLKTQELSKPDRANKYREHKTHMATKSRKTILCHDTMDMTLGPDAGLDEEEKLIFEKENICQDKKNEKPQSRQTVYAVDDMDETTTDFQLKTQELSKPDRANKYREHKTHMATKSRKTILCHDAMDVTLRPDAGLVEEEEIIFEKENICQDKKNEKPNSRQTVYAVDDMDETITDFQLKTQELSKPDRANKYREHDTPMSTKSRKTILDHDAMDATLRPDAGLVEEEKLIFEKENICQAKKNEKPQSRQTVYAAADMDEITTDFQLKTQELSKPDRANKYREHKTHMATKSRKTILCHDAMDVTLRPDAGLVEEEEIIFEKENICQDKKNEKPQSRQTVYAVDDMDETTTDFQLKTQELSKPDKANKYREHNTLMSTKSRKTILGHDAMDVTLEPDAGLVEEEELIFEKENICQDKKNEKQKSRQTVYAAADMDEITTDFQLKFQELPKPDRANKYREHKTHMATKSRKTILGHDAMDVTLRPDAGLVEEEELIFEKENICQDKKNEKPQSRQTVYAVDDMDETTTDFQLKTQELSKPDKANKYREHNTLMSTKSRKTILGYDAMDVTLEPDAGLVEEEELIFEKENICQDKKNEKPQSRQTVYAAADMDEITTDFQLKTQELSKPDRANKYREHKTHMTTKSRKTILCHDAMDVTLRPDAGLVEEEEIIFEKENICQDKKNEKPQSRQTVYAVDDMDETTTDFQLKTQELSKPDRANKYREHNTLMSTKSRKTILGHDAMDVTLEPDAGLVEEEELIFEKENICQDKKNEKPKSRQTVYAVDDMDETTTDFQLKTQELSKPDRANKYREHNTLMSTKSRKTILGHCAMDVTLEPDAGLVEEEKLIFEKENICQDKKNEKPQSRQTVYALDDMHETTTDFQLKYHKQNEQFENEELDHVKTGSSHEMNILSDYKRISTMSNESIEKSSCSYVMKIEDANENEWNLRKSKFPEELELTVPKFNQFSMMEDESLNYSQLPHNKQNEIYLNGDRLDISNMFASNDASQDKFSSTKYYGRKSLCNNQLISGASSRESTLANNTQFLCNLNPLELSNDDKNNEKSHFYNINISPNSSNIYDSHMNIDLINSLMDDVDDKLITIDNNTKNMNADASLLSPIVIKKKKILKLNFYTDELNKMQEDLNSKVCALKKHLVTKEIIDEKAQIEYEPKIPPFRFLCMNLKDFILNSSENNSTDNVCGVPAYFPLLPTFNELLKNKISEDLHDCWSYNDSYYFNDLLKFTNKHIKSFILWIKLSENKICDEFLLFKNVFVEENEQKKPLSTINLLKHREFLARLPFNLSSKCKTSLELIDFLNHLNDICIHIHKIVNTLIEICIENDAELFLDNQEQICIKKTFINSCKKNHKIIFIINNNLHGKHLDTIDIKHMDIGTNDKKYLNICYIPPTINGLLLIETILKIVPL